MKSTGSPKKIVLPKYKLQAPAEFIGTFAIREEFVVGEEQVSHSSIKRIESKLRGLKKEVLMKLYSD